MGSGTCSAITRQYTSSISRVHLSCYDPGRVIRDVSPGARRPNRTAQGARKSGICKRRATQRGGMPRPGVMLRITRPGHSRLRLRSYLINRRCLWQARANIVSEPRERSESAKRRARARRSFSGGGSVKGGPAGRGPPAEIRVTSEKRLATMKTVTNREPRTTNREPRTANREPRYR